MPELSSEAKALRIGHVAVAVVELSSLIYVWACALSGRRDRVLGGAIAALSVQGVALLAGRGNCPLGPLQQRLGDPKPLFELVLPPRAAKAAMPVLVGATLGGLAILLWRHSPVRAVTRKGRVGGVRITGCAGPRPR